MIHKVLFDVLLICKEKKKMTNGVIVQFTLTTMDLSVNKPIEYNLLN